MKSPRAILLHSTIPLTPMGIGSPRRVWLGYGLAVTGTAALLVLHLWPWPQPGNYPALVLFLLPVMLSAYVGGLGPGLVSTVLAALGSDYFLFSPTHSFLIEGRQQSVQWLSLVVAGTVVSILSERFHREIVERNKTEEKLRGSEGRLGAVLGSAMDGIITVDERQRITFFNPAAGKMFKCSASEASGQPLDRFIPERFRSAHVEHMRAFGQTHVTRRTMGQLSSVYGLRSDGEEFPLEASISQSEVTAQKLFTAILRDISERVRSETILQRQAALFDQTYDPILVWDLHGPITFWNRAAEQLYGFPRDEAVGRLSQDLLHTTMAGGFGVIVAALEGDGKWEGELQHTTRDGRRIIVESRMVLVQDAQGARVLEANRDVTERKRAEEALRTANAYNRSLLEASLDPLVAISADGKITDVSTATEKATGLSRQELVGTDFSDYFTDPGKAQAGYQQVFREGLVHDYELELRHRDGQLAPVLYNASLYRDEAGQVVGVFAAARDITERKRAEEEIRKLNEQLEQRVRERTAELEAANKELEAFTYSVSHDLRAPLRHVDGFSKLLVEKHHAELSPDAQEYVATIRESVLQMGMLIDDLLNLARVGRKQLDMQVTGLNSLVEEVRTDLKRANPERAIEWKVGTLPFVECDPGLMKQVFTNLLANAVKFTRPRNPAVVEVGVTDQDGARAVFVRDNGVGFSMKYANKLFGVFQRLHRSEDFEGTGVGLATVQRIIHKHGWSVWGEAALDKGATFYFTLGSPDDPAAGKACNGLI